MLLGTTYTLTSTITYNTLFIASAAIFISHRQYADCRVHTSTHCLEHNYTASKKSVKYVQYLFSSSNNTHYEQHILYVYNKYYKIIKIIILLTFIYVNTQTKRQQTRHKSQGYLIC